MISLHENTQLPWCVTGELQKGGSEFAAESGVQILESHFGSGFRDILTFHLRKWSEDVNKTLQDKFIMPNPSFKKKKKF